MWFAPKIATVANILTRPDARNAFGGTWRFVLSVTAETIFFILLSQVMWLGHALLIASLPFGRPIEWTGQVRDDHSISLAQAAGALWPHTLLGVGALALLGATHPAALPYALFLAGGLALSIPLAVVTALPSMGQLLTRAGIGRLPEETAPPAALRALALPAIDAAQASRRP
jgi:membrane glycosyltransferase